jgi:hypothetical protein
MGTWTVFWRRLRASLRGPSFEDIAAAADGEIDPDFYKRTKVMPNVTKRGAAVLESMALPRLPANVTIAQRGERFMLGWADACFGIWDAWAPTEPVRRFTQDPEGWKLAWAAFSDLEPATAVRARGSWPSSVEMARSDVLPS